MQGLWEVIPIANLAICGNLRLNLELLIEIIILMSKNSFRVALMKSKAGQSAGNVEVIFISLALCEDVFAQLLEN